MFSTNANLPVSPTEVDGRFFTNTLPQLPPIQLGAMQQFGEAIISACIQELQNRAQQNSLRTFFFNLCSQQGWANAWFEKVVGSVARVAEFLIEAHRYQPQQAIGQATNDVALMLSCLMAEKFPALQQYVPQQNVQEVQTQIHKFNQLNQELAQFDQARRQAVQPQGWQQPQAMGWQGQMQAPNQPWMNTGYNQPAMGQRRNVGVNPALRQNPNFQGPSMWQDSFNQPAMGGHPATGSGFNQGLHSLGHAVKDEVTMEPDTPNAPESSPKPSQAPSEADWFNGSQKSSEGRTWHSVSREREWPKVADVNRPYDAILFEDGSELQPEVLSTWTLSDENGLPQAKPLYDHLTHVLFYLKKADGRVVPTIKKKTDDMDYLSNELDPELRKHHERLKAMTSKERVGENRALLKDFRPYSKDPKVAIPAEIEATEEPAFPDGEMPLLKPVMASSLAEGIAKGALLCGDHDCEKQYVVDATKLVAGKAVMVKVIEELGRSSNYEDFVEALVDAERDGTINEAVYAEIRDRATRGLNDALAHQLMLTDWSVDSIVADYKELSDLIEQRFGETALESLHATSERVIGNACHVLKGEELSRYLKLQELSTDKLVVFVDRVTVRTVDWTYADFLAQYGDGGILVAQDAPTLHAGIDKLLDVFDDYRPYQTLKLITKDSVELDIRVSPFSSATFLVHKNA